jgi:hypothetical protein
LIVKVAIFFPPIFISPQANVETLYIRKNPHALGRGGSATWFHPSFTAACKSRML